MEYFNSFSSNYDEIGEILVENDISIVNDKIIKNNRCITSDIVCIKNDEVVNIQKRSNILISGILQLNSNQKYGFNKRNVPYFKFKSISNKFPDFIVPTKNKSKKNLYCVIKLNKWEITNKHPIGQIEYLIGPIGEYENEISILLYHTNLYPKKNKIKYINLEENTNFDYETFSIDPANCVDIDDALHFKTTDKYIEIGIHIANVSRYIDELNTNYYSTIYLKNKQINMLDDKYTYNKFSLGNGKLSKALSLIIHYDLKSLSIIDYYFKETVVKNKALTYKDIDNIIKNKKKSDILELYNFTIKSKKIKSLLSTKLVEHYMVLYNSLFAETLYKYDKNTVLRTHKLNKIDTSNFDEKLSKHIKIINQNAANYCIDPTETKHEDLDLGLYTHATSPIRRYIDIINHKNMINFLEKKQINSTNNIDLINKFQKNLRKFYNYNKKLEIIFNFPKKSVYEAFIININNIKVRIYIPELDIEHSFNIISHKLIEIKNVNFNLDSIEVENRIFKIYDKINIKLTPFPYENIFNKKLNVNII